MNQTVVDAMIRQNAALFANEGVEIVLARPGTEMDDGEGGTILGEPVNVPAQTFLVGSAEPMELQTQTNQGQRLVSRHVIVGAPDADLQDGDTFVLRGDRYIVQYVRHFEHEVRGRCAVVAVL